ncbi:MAG: hypothetical protein LBH82_04505 [Bacteroidales bacterium]|nr:hypothetical protein [Bacteroidales bacterium]
MSYKRTKQWVLYLQLSLIIALYICCCCRIWTINTVIEVGEIWVDDMLGLSKNYVVFSGIITSVFLLLNGVFLLLYLRLFALVERRQYYPVLFYFLFVFFFPQLLNPWSMFTGFVVVTGIFPQLFHLDESNLQAKTFMYGLWCGILTIIDFHFIILLPFIYLTYRINRIYTFRSLIMPLVGSSISFIYLFSVLYLTDNNQYITEFCLFIKSRLHEVSFWNMDFMRLKSVLSANHFISGILVAGNVLVGLFSFLKLWSKAYSEVVNKRKKYYLLLWITALLTVYVLLFQAFNILLNSMLLLLYTIVFSLCFSYLKKYGHVIVLLLSFFAMSVFAAAG